MALAMAAVPLCLASPPARAGTYVATFQPDKSSTNDSYLRQDGATEKNGDKADLRLKTSGDKANNRHPVVSVPVVGLANRTVLQAWLKLHQSAGNSSVPIQSWIYPLTESWSEPDVSWLNRVGNTAWSRAGGTRGSQWASRTAVSDATNGSEVSWQVGPILQAWQLGTLTNYGFLIEAERSGPEREMAFRASETGTASERPELVVHYTDQAPSVRSGNAEIQPRITWSGSTNTSFSMHLSVDASGSTPSGYATGFDVMTIAHGGALVVTALDAVVVGGLALPPQLTSFTDNGTSVTFRFPKVNSQATVRVDFRATVLAAASTYGIDLPVTVDDSSTPGCWAQALWPGNADGVSGNGDDWILDVAANLPQAIRLTPDTLSVIQRACAGFVLTGLDAAGGTFQLTADSMRIVPAGLGTIQRDGTLCGIGTGSGSVIAYWGSLRDTAVAIVRPALTPSISAIALRSMTGDPATALAPGDTMFLDVTLEDGDGFQDVQRLDFDLALNGHENDVEEPAFRAAFRWTRGASPAWSLVQPIGASWVLVPDSSEADSVTTTTGPVTARLAFVPGHIARASTAGEWTARVTVLSATPADTMSATSAGLDCRTWIVLASRDTAGDFNSGQLAATRLPLARPTDGRIELFVTSNAPWNLEGAATDLIGLTSPDTIFVNAANQRMEWSLAPAGGYLDSAFVALGSGPAAATEDPVAASLQLWINHPASIALQSYRGTLRVRAAAGALVAPERSLPLTATVVSGGLAAHTVLAEVVPHEVPAGTTAAPFEIDLLPQIQGGDTGIDRIVVDIPDAYGTPVVGSVQVGPTPVIFVDRSAPGLAEVILAQKITGGSLVRLGLRADAPIALDSLGSSFAVLYDDTATTLPPQAGIEGNANGLSDGNSWNVHVVPGPLFRIELLPDSTACYVGGSVPFAALGFDAYGHPVAPTVTWSVEGGIGSIDSGTGLFSATASGLGRVIAQSGALADTAKVRVWQARAIAVRSVTGPTSVYQGQTGVTLQARIENLGGVAVALDTLRLAFGRGVPGDADGDFQATPLTAMPETLAVGSAAVVSFDVVVRPDALSGPLAVNAGASGIEVGVGARLTDVAADTTLALAVQLGGLEIAATQASSSTRPGELSTAILELQLHNQDPEARTLLRLTMANHTRGPGDAGLLDGELGDVTLFADDGDQVFEPDRDTLLVKTTALEGFVWLAPLDLSIAAGGLRRLFVASDVPLTTRDGDVLDLMISSALDVQLSSATAVKGTWPLDPAGGLTVDGMVAQQIGSSLVGAPALKPGETDQPVLKVLVPPNGYEADQLTRLSVANRGSALPGVDLVAIRAWTDDGDGAFDAAKDPLLGAMVFTGDRWQLSGLSTVVPLQGLMVFFTADLSGAAVDGRTVRMALPTGADPGLGMASGNSGPIDRELVSPQIQQISGLDRVVVTAMPLPSGQAHPGERGRLVLQLAMTNGYDSERTLRTLVVDDGTTGPGTVQDRDGEIRALILRADQDQNGVLDPDVDPVVATAVFRGGVAEFTGLSWSIPALQSRQLFVTADLSPTGAADGDVVAGRVTAPSSVGFAEPTAVAANWPVDSGARWTVDGMVAAQAVINPSPSATLAPGDGPILALDLVIPPNGYQSDVLRSVRVVNLGSASAADLAEVQLWSDGGDGVFSAGSGDDTALAPLTAQSGGWQSPLLSSAIAPPGLRLFVSITVAGGAAESTTVRLAVPVNGLQLESGNDGPLDVQLASTGSLLLSRAPLLAGIELPPASGLGQQVQVRMWVRNVGAEMVQGITPSALGQSGPGWLEPVSGSAPASVALGPGASDTLTWIYAAAVVGETRLSGGASGTGSPSGLPRQAIAVSSPSHRVFGTATRLELTPVQTMPATVTRGETDVIPMSFTLGNPGGADVSDVRLRGLRLRLETEGGGPVVPSELLSRVAVNEGTNTYLVKTALETSGSDVDLQLATPVRVTGTEPVTISLRLDITPGTTQTGFRIVVVDSTSFTAEDATTGAPANVALVTGAYPVRSNPARIVEDASDLEISEVALDSLRAAPGTTAIVLLAARLENPGVTGITSDVRLAAFTLELGDSLGRVANPGRRLKAVRVLEGSRLLGSRSVTPGDSARLSLALATPLNLVVNTPTTISVEADLADDASLGTFWAIWNDSSSVAAYDANTRAAVAVHLDPDSIRGARIRVETKAETLLASHVPLLPDSVVIGQIGVDAIAGVLRHPGALGTGPVRVDSLRIALRDAQRRPLIPAAALDRIHLRWNGIEIASAAVSTGGLNAMVPLGRTMEAGDTASIAIAVDIDATAPAGTIELMATLDVSDGNGGGPVSLVPDQDAELPMVSGVAWLVPPSRELVVRLQSTMPTVLVGDGLATDALNLFFTNSDPGGSGTIRIEGLEVRAADDAFTPLAVGVMASRLEARVGGNLWAQSATLTPDSTTASLIAATPLEIADDRTVTVELRWTPRPGLASGRVRLGCDRDGIRVVQPSSALLRVQVLPAQGQTFPLWSESGGFGPASLESSYANFPNPFAAGREATRFVYHLEAPARVSLRIMTLRGEPVASVVTDEARGVGLHQADAWNGRNGKGALVWNGVYAAELTVRFDDGHTERLLRKVAVVR
jgi:hypothetical protein